MPRDNRGLGRIDVHEVAVSSCWKRGARPSPTTRNSNVWGRSLRFGHRHNGSSIDSKAASLAAASPTRTSAFRYDQSTTPARLFRSGDRGQPLASRGTDTVRILRR